MTSSHPPDDAAVAALVPPHLMADADRLRRHRPDDFRAELVRRGWLTPLQMRWLAHGRLPVVGPYVIVDRLGRGGMGDVHLARHRHLGRSAALKTSRTRLGRNDRARFLREAEALGRVDHPHVVHAYDAGEDRGIRWLALEYIGGPTLARMVADDGPLAPGVACAFARQAALGLAHLHEKGVVHRDVKPANLAVADGIVKVLDVGLAKSRWWAAADTSLTRAGVLLGSPDYAAPEQVVDPRRANHRADQWGLGAALHFLLTGAPPFTDGSVVERALRRVREAVPRIDEVRPGLPTGLGEVVDRLLARRARDRFGSMAEAADALAPFAAAPVVTDTHSIPALTEADIPTVS